MEVLFDFGESVRRIASAFVFAFRDYLYLLHLALAVFCDFISSGRESDGVFSRWIKVSVGFVDTLAGRYVDEHRVGVVWLELGVGSWWYSL